MNERMSLSEIKAAILKKRRQRIRRHTYAYVADAIIADATTDQPFRHRLIFDWWNRVVDPLEAEKFDVERLRYFRSRLKEHRNSAAHNAAVRQGKGSEATLRRLNTTKLAYIQHQVQRLSDRSLNYAAAERAVAENDQAFERLAEGLVALPELRTRPFGRLERIALRCTCDPRFPALAERLRSDPTGTLPDVTPKWIEQRLAKLTDEFDPIWLFGDDYIETKRREGLIRKLEEEYMNEI